MCTQRWQGSGRQVTAWSSPLSAHQPGARVQDCVHLERGFVFFAQRRCVSKCSCGPTCRSVCCSPHHAHLSSSLRPSVILHPPTSLLSPSCLALRLSRLCGRCPAPLGLGDLPLFLLAPQSRLGPRQGQEGQGRAAPHLGFSLCFGFFPPIPQFPAASKRCTSLQQEGRGRKPEQDGGVPGAASTSQQDLGSGREAVPKPTPHLARAPRGWNLALGWHLHLVLCLGPSLWLLSGLPGVKTSRWGAGHGGLGARRGRCGVGWWRDTARGRGAGLRRVTGN